MLPAEGNFEELLTRSREELRALAVVAEEAKTRAGTGTAAHGWVRVTAVDGRITDVHVDSRASRMSPRELGAAFAEAANAALAELAAAFPVPALPNIDPEALEQELAEVRLESERRMRAIYDQITDVVRHIT